MFLSSLYYQFIQHCQAKCKLVYLSPQHQVLVNAFLQPTFSGSTSCASRDACIAAVIMRLKKSVYAPEEVLVTQGESGLQMFFILDGIVDVIDVEPTLDTSTATPGVRGSTVILGQVTDVIDVAALAADAGIIMRHAS